VPARTKHKTVQSRVLKCAQEIGWTYVPRAADERRRGFDPAGVTPEEVLPQRNAKENAR